MCFDWSDLGVSTAALAPVAVGMVMAQRVRDTIPGQAFKTSVLVVVLPSGAELVLIPERTSKGSRVACGRLDQFADPGVIRIAINHTERERDVLAVTDEEILAQRLAQTEKGLAQVLPGLGIEMRAPQQGCQFLAWLRSGSSAGEVRQRAGQLSCLVVRRVRPARTARSGREASACTSWVARLASARPRALRVGSLPWHGIVHFSRYIHEI
jgi:hypothetical protein